MLPYSVLRIPAAPRKIPSSGILAAYASLSLPDRSGREVSWWAESGLECGVLPSDCAPVRSVVRWKYVVGNDPCVVPHRLSVTFQQLVYIPQNAICSVPFSNQMPEALCSHFSHKCVESFEGGLEGTFSKVPSIASPASPRPQRIPPAE